MRTQFKISYLPMAALVLAAGAAVATTSPEKPKNALVQTWERTAPDGSATGSWQPSSDSQCLSSDKMCKADFAIGYDPSEHTEAENDTAAISGSVTQGYVQQF